MCPWGVDDPPPPQVVTSVMGIQYPLAGVGVMGMWGISKAMEQADDEAGSVKRYLFLSGL